MGSAIHHHVHTEIVWDAGSTTPMYSLTFYATGKTEKHQSLAILYHGPVHAAWNYYIGSACPQACTCCLDSLGNVKHAQMNWNVCTVTLRAVHA